MICTTSASARSRQRRKEKTTALGNGRRPRQFSRKRISPGKGGLEANGITRKPSRRNKFLSNSACSCIPPYGGAAGAISSTVFARSAVRASVTIASCEESKPTLPSPNSLPPVRLILLLLSSTSKTFSSLRIRSPCGLAVLSDAGRRIQFSPRYFQRLAGFIYVRNPDNPLINLQRTGKTRESVVYNFNRPPTTIFMR